MSTVRRRSTTATGNKTASRRRDRVADDDDETEEEEDVDTTARRRPPSSRVKTSTRTRQADPEDEDDVEDEDEEDEKPPARSRSRSSSGVSRSRRSTAKDDDDDDDDVAPRSRKAAGRSGKKSGTLPEGVRKGWAGAEATLKAGGSGATRLALGAEAELVKFLQPEPLLSFRQHWVEVERGQGNRPFLCPGKDCPLCESVADRPAPAYVYNVLHMSNGGIPEVKILQFGTKAHKALEAAATDKRSGKIDIEKDYWSILKSGKGTKAQTVPSAVKERDLEDDWDEIFEFFDPDELPLIIEEAMENLYEENIVEGTPRRKLEDIARYLNDED